MALALRDNIFYCIANNRVALLDLKANALFCLPDSLDSPFQAWAGGDPDQAMHLEPLLRRGILVRSEAGVPPRPPCLETPSRTWDSASARSPSSIGVLGAISDQIATMAMLKCIPIHILLGHTAAQKKAARHRTDPIGDPGAIRALSEMFGSRAFIGTQNKCVRWSIAITRHLRGVQAYPDLVFGIRMAPFSAHAWVQCKDMILSDTADHAAQYTPLLVI